MSEIQKANPSAHEACTKPLSSGRSLPSLYVQGPEAPFSHQAQCPPVEHFLPIIRATSTFSFQHKERLARCRVGHEGDDQTRPSPWPQAHPQVSRRLRVWHGGYPGDTREGRRTWLGAHEGLRQKNTGAKCLRLTQASQKGGGGQRVQAEGVVRKKLENQRERGPFWNWKSFSKASPQRGRGREDLMR